MKSMRQLINLMEGVVAIPGVGKIEEKSTSEKQARFMAAAAHDPKFAKKVGMDTSVAKEFNKADTGTKQLSNAMKNKTEESMNPNSFEKPAAWRIAQGQKPLTPRDLKNQEAEGRISHPTTLAQNRGAVPTPSNEGCVMDEEVGSEAIQELAAKLAAGEISYEEFKEHVESLENTDYSMRQGEMGMQGDDTPAGNRAWDQEQDDYGNDSEDYDEFEEALDLNNGYDDINDAKGDDFFPNGADSPVVKTVGPSGARQGDNPEQKKMQVAEVHKELVYGYRNYLKESAKENHENNLDAAQREMDSREAEGEDMSDYYIDKKTYKLVKKAPAKKA